MSIKTVNPKFATDPVISDNKAVIDPAQEKQAQSLIKDLESAYKKLDANSSYYEFLSLEEQAKIETMKSRIGGEIALLEAFLETGEWNGVGGSSVSDLSWYESLPELGAGWHSSNAQHQTLSHSDPEFAGYEAILGPEHGYLKDVIEVPKGSYNVEFDTLEGAALGLVITDDKPVKKITGETIGKDIFVTIEYESSEVETTVLKGVAIRQDVMLYISAEQCTKDIIMDFSKTTRISIDADGKIGTDTNGLILVGGKGNDIIIGSQANDTLIGWEGDDKLFGVGGKDTIFGDGAYKNDVNDYLHSVNDGKGGSDYIDGGDGYDVTYGGGGTDTAVQDINSPNGTEYPQEIEYFTEFKDMVNWSDFDESMLSMPGWEHTEKMETGEIVLTKTPNVTDNQIHINAPDGYTMAHAEDDGNDIVITFAKMGDDGNQSYLRFRIKGALATDNQTLIEVKATSESTIIDFSKLHSGSNIIKLTGNNGSDSLIGPTSNLDELGIDASELEKGSTLDLKKIIANQTEDNICNFGGNEWDSANVVDDHIELTPYNNDKDLKLIFQADGLTCHGAFYEKDAEGNLWLYGIEKINDDDFDLVKIKIVGGATNGKIDSIMIGGAVAKPLGYTVFEGSGGDDVIIGSTASTKNWGETNGNDTIIKGYFTAGLDVNEGNLSNNNMDDIAVTADGTFVTDLEDGNYSKWDEDADGDGISNQEEIDAGKDPMDKEDKPSS